ncbi:MAG TPA: class II fumarate hydratase [Chromatiales bacterium]|nr:class II fumarate hydratase [Thiotrichales bacterium]HIP68698.1 class II fumarate hydratase [Chromatiales bacterium]
MTDYRIEQDSMGEVQVPADALYGAQTQRAVENFPISGLKMPRSFIRALGLVKAASAAANAELDELDDDLARAIAHVALAVADGKYDDQFPVDVFQTGSGTSTNMNANEVIATLATEELGQPVHPNDHVNKGQSSNDVIPTAIHVAATLEIETKLLPALDHLAEVIETRAEELKDVVKTGRTHLMDAMPVSFGQELGCWAAQVRAVKDAIAHSIERMRQLPVGGTAVGTGINAHPDLDEHVAKHISKLSNVQFKTIDNKFMGLSSQDAAIEMSGHTKSLAVVLIKIANDLRWMNSGPLAGIGEICLPALQPGSSIMPGKVNPVIPEAVCMVAAQVIGNDATVTIAGQAGNFQLNVMLPVVALNLLQSIEILSNASRQLADKAITGFTVNENKIKQALDKNPILVTALNNDIGYELGAKIAKTAYAEGRPVIDVAEEMTDLSKAELAALLNPKKLI